MTPRVVRHVHAAPGEERERVRAGLLRDTYADVQDGTGDNAWATVSFRVATAEESWEESSPCLNTFELGTLADWLASLADDPGEEPSALELLEPELPFSVTSRTKDGMTIRVGFHLEDRPSELDVDAATEDLVYVELIVTPAQVRVAAGSLRAAFEELGTTNLKDDLTGDGPQGAMGMQDADVNLIDRVTPEPPGAGAGEDNAGER